MGLWETSPECSGSSSVGSVLLSSVQEPLSFVRGGKGQCGRGTIRSKVLEADIGGYCSGVGTVPAARNY